MPRDRRQRYAPTIGELLLSEPRWVWATCDQIGCGHRVPIALVPYAIRWGMDVSSDVLRRSLRCTRCGTKGAEIMMPSWRDKRYGWCSFPTEERSHHGKAVQS